MNTSFQMVLKAKLETFHSEDFTGFHENFLDYVDFVLFDIYECGLVADPDLTGFQISMG